MEQQKRLTSPEEVRQLFNISKPTEIRWRNQGKLPEPLIMARRVYYRTSDLEKLINPN